MRFLLSKGGLYKICNQNLLYHGCVPLAEDGSLKKVSLYGKEYQGKSLYEMLESSVRKGFYAMEEERKKRSGFDVVYLAGKRFSAFWKG